MDNRHFLRRSEGGRVRPLEIDVPGRGLRKKMPLINTPQRSGRGSVQMSDYDSMTRSSGKIQEENCIAQINTKIQISTKQGALLMEI